MKTHVAWLNSAQAAAHLGFPSVNAFHVWLHRQREDGNPKLKVHWLAGRMRFRVVELDALVEPEPSVEVKAPIRLVGGRAR